MFTVQLVDDEPIVRRGLRKLIDWEALGFQIVCEAENGEQALEQLEEYQIDVIITDIGMPFMNGIEFMKRVRERDYPCEILVLTAYSEFEYAKSAIRNKVMEYILKPIEERQISEVLERVRMTLEEKKEQIDFYKLHSAKAGKERKFSRENDKLLIKYIMTNNPKAMKVLENIIEEEKTFGDAEIASMCVRFSYILEEIVGRINETFIYLSKLKNISDYLHYGETVGDTKENLIHNFSYNIKELMSILEESKVIYRDNVVMQACQYVVEHVDEDVNLTSVSKKLAISKNYFCTLFKNETGENFLSFVTRIKMRRAQFLLREENLRVYEVCDILGYTDTTYFSRLFKKYTHMTPNEYKKGMMEQHE